MSYFDAQAAKKRTAAATATPHIKKDVGFGEAYASQRLNTYGMLDENNIIGRKTGDVATWAFTNHSDLAWDFTSQLEGIHIPQNATAGLLDHLRTNGVEIPKEFDFSDALDLESRALAEEGERYKERQKVLNRSTGFGKFGAFVGGVTGSMDDIENIVTLPVGATGRMGIAMTSLVEGGVNAGIEGIAFGPRQRLLEKMGVQSNETRLQAMRQGFVGGAVMGGGIRTLTGPEIYRLAGSAIRSAGGLRKSAEVLKDSDDPLVSTQGHAIAEELDHRARHKALTGESAQGLERQVAQSTEAANRGLLSVPVRTSDDAVRFIDVGADIARTSRLFERFDAEEVITLQEIDQIAGPGAVTALERNVIEYYDMMDARFRGQEVPDEFDPIDDALPNEIRRDAKFEREVRAMEEAATRAKAREDEIAAINKAANAEIREIRKAASEARKASRRVQNYPIITRLKNMGGVDPTSPVADELRAMGVTAQSHPGLYRKGGLREIDNIEGFEDELIAKDGDYLDRQDILNGIDQELRKSPRRTVDESRALNDVAASDAEIDQIRARADEQINSLAPRATEGLDAAMDALQARIAVARQRRDEIERIRQFEETPADYNGDLTRLSRGEAQLDRVLEEGEADLQEQYTGIMSEVGRIAVQTEEGGVRVAPSDDIIRELIEDQEFAEQIKLCGLQ